MPDAPAIPCTVFISYTHDTPEHGDRVWDLSERLRHDGIDCRVDQQEESPAEGWPRWCRNRIEEARYVLLVCTETYCQRYEGEDESGKGLGGKWEGHVITQELYDAQGRNTKFIPIVFSSEQAPHIPLELHGATRYDLSANDGYESLLRRLTDQPRKKASPVGTVPTLPTLERKAQPPARLFTVPLPQNPFFTERAHELADLQTALENTGSFALTGLGGVGKTQTAAEYAHRQREHYQAVLWLRAENPETLFADLTALARLLKLPDANAQEQQLAVDAAQRWLDDNDNWLLILDNVNDLKTVAALTRLASPQRRHVIVTQQAQATGVIETDKLGMMNAETGALLLLRRAKLIPADSELSAANYAEAAAAREISREVGGLPLALDQAGAYIEQTGCGVREYLDLLRTSLAELLGIRGELDFQHRSVTATYTASLTELAKQNEAAAQLLNAAAFLAPDAIPEEIFTTGASQFPEALQQAAANRLLWNDAIAAAFKFSLLERNAADKTISVHRMVQAVANAGMTSEARAQWADRVVNAVEGALPNLEFANWGIYERLNPHTQVCATLIYEFGLSTPRAARLLNDAGLYLRDRARYVEAESRMQRALDTAQKTYSSDEPEVAVSLNNLAQLLQDTNRHSEAEPLMQRVVQIFEKAYSPDHPNVATALNNLAQLLQHTNRVAEAEPLMRRALAIDEESYGPDHPTVARDLNNLATLLQANDRQAEAEPLMRRALAIDEQSYGPDHPNVARDLNNLARLFEATNRFADAEPLMRRVVEITFKFRRDTGHEDPNQKMRISRYRFLLQQMGHSDQQIRDKLQDVAAQYGVSLDD